MSNQKSIKPKPNLFCPACGHNLVLRQLGAAIDELNIRNEAALGVDIGCSLLAWDFFNVDTLQTHHGRTVPVMVGFKMARPERVAVAYMGDGGAYAIGLQSLLHCAMRNDPITVIVINNENYAMTGGQMSPTTLPGRITLTSPKGKKVQFGKGLKGPEMIRRVASRGAWIGRASVGNLVQLKIMLKEAIENQIKNNEFSFLEVLSSCPTNWKMTPVESLERIKEMEKEFPLGKIKYK